MSSNTRILYRRIVNAASSLSNTLPATTTTQVPTNESSEPDQSPSDGHGPTPPLIEIKGIIFDMDGTLTIPVLNFSEMKTRLGLSPNQDILPTVQSYPPEERAKAMSIIEEFEEEGVHRMKLQPGILELLHYIAKRGVKRALMTRNSMKATKVFLDRLNKELSDSQNQYPHLKQDSIFSQVITREYEPCKPNPSPALHICQQWQLEPQHVLIIGDDKTDMVCGIRAGTGLNILLRNERNKTQVDYSNFTVTNLSDIITLFSTPMDITPRKEEPLLG